MPGGILGQPGVFEPGTDTDPFLVSFYPSLTPVLTYTLDAHKATITTDPDTVIEVDRLLHRMQDFDARKAKIVEMLFFGGMTYDEIAEVLGISAVTVHRDLKMAKA